MHAREFLAALLRQGRSLGDGFLASVARISEHVARDRPDAGVIAELLDDLSSTTGNAKDSIIIGLRRGWPDDHKITLDARHDAMLTKLFREASPEAKGMLARLARSFSSDALAEAVEPMMVAMIDTVEDPQIAIEQRVAVATQLFELNPDRSESIAPIAALIGPQSPVELSTGLLRALGRSEAPDLDRRVLEIARSGTPAIRDHPDLMIRHQARRLMNQVGLVNNTDRQQLVTAKMPLTERTGDVDRGKAVFTKNCATCHEPIEAIELVKPEHRSAPIVLAITVELAGKH